MLRDVHPRTFRLLATVFALFVLFLYGPTITILSFQGPEGGLGFPMNGLSLRWFAEVFRQQSTGVVHGGWRRSIALGPIVMVLTVAISFLAGLAFRSRFEGATLLLHLVVASLGVPSIVVSLGIAALFELVGIERTWWGSGLAAHLTWPLPFRLFVMFAVVDRFDRRLEGAARHLGVTGVPTVRHVVIPVIAPSLVGVGPFGFTLSHDELARSSQVLGDLASLPLEREAMQSNATTPAVYIHGTLTTGVSFLVIAVSLATLLYLRRRRARRVSDAGKGTP